ncbi:hypothetical protein D3C87_1511110 [compost metagenome]
MDDLAQCRYITAFRCNSLGGLFGDRDRVIDQPPDALLETARAFDPRFGPLHVAFRRRVGEHEPARGVGAIAADNLIRIDDVLLGLAHLFDRANGNRRAGDGMAGAALVAIGLQHHFGRIDPFALVVAIGLVGHHPLGEQALEGFVQGHMTGGLHGAGEEARIEQVQDGMLHTADILVDREPAIGHGGNGRRIGMGRREAGEIPG